MLEGILRESREGRRKGARGEGSTGELGTTNVKVKGVGRCRGRGGNAVVRFIGLGMGERDREERTEEV